MNIKLRVTNLVKKYGTSDPFLIAAFLNIDILPVSLPQSLRGFLVRVLKRKIILLNNKLSESSSKVVVCHEIGHARMHLGYGYYFHPDRTYYISSKREREANEFAIHLLSYSCDINSDSLAMVINEKKPDPMTVHRILASITNYN